MAGASIKRICESTKKLTAGLFIKYKRYATGEKEIAKYDLKTLPDDVLKDAKFLGFSDEQIVTYHEKKKTPTLFMKEEKAMGLTRVFKMVDTCSAEFEAKTPYFYSTFEQINNKAMLLR